jgi:hypothetical protein
MLSYIPISHTKRHRVIPIGHIIMLIALRKRRNQGFPVIKLKSSLWSWKSYGRQHELVNSCGVYLSQMTTICWICSVYCNHNAVLSSFVTCQRICNKSNTTGATCGVGTAFSSRAPEFTPTFNRVHITRFLVFSVMLCWSLFVFFPLAIVFSVFQYTASDYPFRIFKLFFLVYPAFPPHVCRV